MAESIVQTLGTGSTLSQKFQSMGFTNVQMQVSCHHNFMALVGKSGEGKSTMMQSCPDALIINADCSPSVTLGPLRATIVPGIRPSDGRPVIPNPSFSNDPEKGTPFILDWNYIIGVVNTLIECKDEPGRPKIVVIDTVDRAYELLKQHMAVESKGPGASFHDLHGLKAWPESYERMVKVATDLTAAGYGVCFIFHMGNRFVHLGDNKKEYVKDIPLIQANLWEAVRSRINMCGWVESKTRKTQESVPQVGPDGVALTDGAGKPVMGSELVEKTVHTLTFAPENAREVTKKRLSMMETTIILPHDSPWQAYEDAYNRALAGESNG